MIFSITLFPNLSPYFSILNLVRTNSFIPSYFSQMLDCFWMSHVCLSFLSAGRFGVSVAISWRGLAGKVSPQENAFSISFMGKACWLQLPIFDTFILLKLILCIFLVTVVAPFSISLMLFFQAYFFWFFSVLA